MGWSEDGPLHGVRVVELGRRVQGPVAGLVLAQLGARVVRVEPEGGDPHRGLPPYADGISAYFQALNRGKRAVTANLRDPAGRDCVRELVADADVFLHNLAPGRAEALGLGPDDLLALRPGLVHGYASGWGADAGPAGRHGTDYLVQAYAGLGELLRPADEPPVPTLFTVLDTLGGLVTAEGIVAALLARAGDDTGRVVRSGLLPAAGVLQLPAARGLSGAAANRPHWTEVDRPIATADGLLALPEGVAAARIQSLRGGRAWTADSTADWLDRLRRNGVPAVEVATTLADVAADPGLAELLCHRGATFTRTPWRIR